MEQFKMYQGLNFGELKASHASNGVDFHYQCTTNEGEVAYRTKTHRVYAAIAVIKTDRGDWECLNRFGRLDLVHSRVKDYAQSQMHKITLFVIHEKYQLANQI